MDVQMVKQGDSEAKDQEIALLQKKVSELESQLGEAQKLIQKHLLEANEVDLLKMRSSDTLTKAKSVIFENTKMIKNQELQIEALNKQVESLRDVVKITKDLLEIRNLEVDQLETKIHCMEEKYKAEKERQDLMHQKLEQMIRHNGELKREYEAQLCLFQALRERYDERELAKGVVNALRADIKTDKEQKEKTEQNVQEPEIRQNEQKVTQNVQVQQNINQREQNTPTDEKAKDLNDQHNSLPTGDSQNEQNIHTDGNSDAKTPNDKTVAVVKNETQDTSSVPPIIQQEVVSVLPLPPSSNIQNTENL